MKKGMDILLIILILSLIIFLTACDNLVGEASRQKILPAYQEKCSDSDGGINLEEKGTTKGLMLIRDGSKTPTAKTDECKDNQLVEYYCSRGLISSKIETCPENYLCKRGSCVSDHCSDGIYNFGEEGLDCGWTCPNECVFTEKSGVLIEDETWLGNVYVNDYVKVLEGVTLTILPGTIVKFKHSRDYKTFDRGNLVVDGGNIQAIGTPDEMIWFTSDAPDPINGDWGGITLENNMVSKFDYVVVEYGEMGIEQFDSTVPVTNSIVRWSNAEGLYAERSSPTFRNNILYSNAYHEIALEQHNKNVIIEDNIFHDGIGAVHNQKTETHIEGNYFYNYEWDVITGGIDAEIEIIGNKFEDISSDSPNWVYDSVEAVEGIIIQLQGGAIAFIQGNDFGDSSVSVPNLNFEDMKNFELGYIPGDPEDQYPYIYDEEDETRKVISKIGEGLGFGWTLESVEGYLYRFIGSGGESGEYMDFIEINPETGEYTNYGYYEEIINPRGLTWDGEYFYANDASNLKIFKFRIEDDNLIIYDSFDVPHKDSEVGTNGLTTNGEFLYLRSPQETVYKLTKNGELVDELDIPGVSLVWTGEHFWTVGGCGKDICKFDEYGNLIGEIYPAANGALGITWDGEYLWTLQRTCETWNDPKIYKIEILNDSLSEPEDPPPIIEGCFFDTSLECLSYQINNNALIFNIKNTNSPLTIIQVNQYFMDEVSGQAADCPALSSLSIQINKDEEVEINMPCQILNNYVGLEIETWVQIVAEQNGEEKIIDGTIVGVVGEN
jgi:hypothetical protein